LTLLRGEANGDVSEGVEFSVRDWEQGVKFIYPYIGKWDFLSLYRQLKFIPSMVDNNMLAVKQR